MQHGKATSDGLHLLARPPTNYIVMASNPNFGQSSELLVDLPNFCRSAELLADLPNFGPICRTFLGRCSVTFGRSAELRRTGQPCEIVRNFTRVWTNHWIVGRTIHQPSSPHHHVLICLDIPLPARRQKLFMIGAFPNQVLHADWHMA